MQRFDPSCGLTKRQIGTIKYMAKNAIMKRLPVFPESVEMKLFLQGRDAWIFTWCLIKEQLPINSTNEFTLEITAKLKKEFHQHQELKQHKYLCRVQLNQDIYRSKLSITDKDRIHPHLQ